MCLAQKEQLMSQMVANDDEMSKMRSTYEKAIQQLQSQIDDIAKEKEDLVEQIHKTPKNASNKWDQLLDCFLYVIINIFVPLSTFFYLYFLQIWNI